MGHETGNETSLTRRNLLRLGGGCLVAGLVTQPAEAARSVKGERILTFESIHTGEKFRRAYWVDGRYIQQSLREIHRLLRDYRTDEVRSIDVRLLDLLHDLHRMTGSRKPFEIICAYRSPTTNQKLAQTNDGVAQHSYHTRGMAIDIRLPDRDLSKLRQAALKLQRGGVGYYPSSDFVHVDVGPQRTW